MEHDYNFFADMFSTFRSCNDWIKALIILVPFATFATCFIGWRRRKTPAASAGSESKAASAGNKNTTESVDMPECGAGFPGLPPAIKGKPLPLSSRNQNSE